MSLTGLCLMVTIGAMSHVEASSGWSLTASMSTPRTGHTATLLPDGRVLVSGGQWTDQNSDDGGFRTVEATAEIYDPRQGTWSPTASMSTPRYIHTATLLPDGRVLVSGGYNNTNGGAPTDSVELYDPGLGTWSQTGR